MCVILCVIMYVVKNQIFVMLECVVKYLTVKLESVLCCKFVIILHRFLSWHLTFGCSPHAGEIFVFLPLEGVFT